MRTSGQKSNERKPLHALFSSTLGPLTINYTGVHCAPNEKEMS
jgi:hypothetical protein